MSRTAEDARRSISYFLSLVYPDYDHYLGRYEGEFSTPAVVLHRIGPRLRPGRAWHTIENVQPYSVYVLPEPQSTSEASETVAVREEHRLHRAMDEGVKLGWNAWFGGRDRIPLCDFDGLSLDEPLPADRGHNPDGMLWVIDFQSNPVPDEGDERRWSINCTLRVRWLHHGRKADPMPALVTRPPWFTGRHVS